MATEQIQIRHWTRDEYDRLVEAGFFQPGERLELVDGEIVQKIGRGSCRERVEISVVAV